MKIRRYQQKKDYFIYEVFYINLMVTTTHKSRAETWKTKVRKQKNIIENQQIKVANKNTSNTKKKKRMEL